MADENLKELIDDIKRLLPLEEYVGQFLNRGKSSGDNIFFNSPWSNDSTPSFNVSKSKQIWKDFTNVGGPRLVNGKSVSSGDIVAFAMQYHDISFYEAISLLAEEVGVDLSQYPGIKFNQSKMIVPTYDELQLSVLDINQQAQMFFAYNFSAIRDVENRISKAENYATQLRGFTAETIKEFGLGYAHNDYAALYNFLSRKGYKDDELKNTGLFSFKDNGIFDVFNNRLMVPVLDRDGNVLGWGGRGLDGSDYKYLNSSSTPVFEKNKILFRLDQARAEIRKNGFVMLMEGFLDVVSAWQYGFRNVVASMGTSFTNNHLDVLTKVSDTVVLAFDGDGAGIKATLRVFDDFFAVSKKTTVKAILIPDGLDPDDFLRKYGAEEFNNLLDNAMTYIEFKLKINQDILKKSMDDITVFKKDIFNDFIRLQLEPTELRIYLDKLSEILRVDLSVLIDDFSNYSTSQKPFVEHIPPRTNDPFSFDQTISNEPIPENSLKVFNFSQIKSMDDVKKIVYKHLNSIFSKDNEDAFLRILEWKAKNPSMDMLECSWVDYFLQNDVRPSKLIDFRVVANLMDYLSQDSITFDHDKIYGVIGTVADKSKGVPIYFVNRNDPNTLRRSTYLWIDALKLNDKTMEIDDLSVLIEKLVMKTADFNKSFVELPYPTKLIYKSLPLFKPGEVLDSIRSYSNKKGISLDTASLILDDITGFSKTFSQRFNLTKTQKLDLFYESVLSNTLSSMVNSKHEFTIDSTVLKDSFSYFKKNFNDMNKNLIVSSKKMDMSMFEFLFTHLSKFHLNLGPKKEKFYQQYNYQQQEEHAR